MNATLPLRILAILCIALPPLAFAVTAYVSYRAEFAAAREQLQRAARLIQEHAINVFETHQLASQQVEEILYGLSDEEIRARASALSPRLRQIVDRLPQIQDIWVLDRDGRPLVAGNVFPLPPNMDLSDRAYYRVHRDGKLPAGQTYVSEVLHGRAQGLVFFQLSNSRRSATGAFGGVVAVSVQPGYFLEFFRNVAGSTISGSSLVREDGAVLARFPATVEQLPDLPRATTLLPQIARSPVGGYYEAVSEFDRIPRLVAYQRLMSYPVYVAASLNRDTVVARWRAGLLDWLLFGLPAFLGLVALSVIALRLNTKESEALAQLRAEVARRESSEAQIRQMQKMEAVGQLTGGVAHDFNNLLTIVMGSLDMLRRRLERGDTDVMRYVESALDGAQRAATLTGRLLAFARRQPLDPVPTDVNKLVRGMSDLLERTLGEHIQVETVLSAGLWQVRIDASQLENAIINLAVNARDAMPSGGKLTVETGNAYLDDAYVRNVPELAAGQYVLIAVSDTGTGMTADMVGRVFEPFFTTKPVGQGTGLGLSQVYGFVRQSGGHVSIYSEPQQGTTVKVYLPRHIGSAKPAVAEAPSEPTRSSGLESVLVVEDEAGVRDFTSQALTTLGYRVYEAEGAETALRLLEEHPDIALLLTDIVMPGMNGRELAETAAERRPLKVLYTTGYSRNAIIHNGILDPGILLLVKPFTLDDLASKVRQALDT